MEIMLLTIVLLYFVWSIAVLVFDADIWLRNKLRIEKPKVEPKESPPIPADDFIVRHTYTVSPKKVPSEPVQIKQEDDGETIRENEVTFEEDQSSVKSARIPDNKLDEVFTDTRIEDVDVKYDESEEEPVVEQASGNSFEEIDKAVETASKPNATNEECSHAGKVFSEMEGNELFNMIAERSQIIKRRMNALMELHMSNISTVKPISEKVKTTMKKRNSVKRQIPSIDDKELYEIYMRNHDECKKKIHKQIDACLDEAFPNSSSYKENDLEGDVTFGNFEMGQFEPIDRTEKNRSEQYVDKFMVDADFTVRPRKQIYIREETHERIMKLVNVVGKGQVSMSSYIDNIINEHFNVYDAEIKTAFEEGIKAYGL